MTKLPPLTAEYGLGPAHGVYSAGPGSAAAVGLHPMVLVQPTPAQVPGFMNMRNNGINPCPVPNHVCWGEGVHSLWYDCCAPNESCTLDESGVPGCTWVPQAQLEPPDGEPDLYEPPPPGWTAPPPSPAVSAS